MGRSATEGLTGTPRVGPPWREPLKLTPDSFTVQGPEESFGDRKSVV